MEIDGLLMHQLFQTTRIISYSLNRYFSPYDLHFSEWGIIITLMEREPMTQRGLAAYLNVEPAAISKSLTRMERKGLIMREVGSDRREKRVFLTEEAKKNYQVWNNIAGEHRKAVLADLDWGKKNEIYQLLKGICQATQQCEEKKQ
ncbi:MarR family winged helix-turn-helix transcriptional regulator [Sporomusa malonica]|uniref:DNA-binding transcriptional regulator, MarR family n=1 Tax=Sporomusa malonica TaxID=112901 RepID=A0A1W2EDZ0_9FIRM|nr:MarR family transcriptional regulator [Sporomusa malonica]SMD07536.1 DNA-binding transcriptional regulator, MarR family [Sporomusa malonica]